MGKSMNNIVDVEFDTFDLDSLFPKWPCGDGKWGKIIYVLGKRNTGKTKIVLDILAHNRDVPVVTCISLSDQFNRTYAKHIPSRFIFHKYTPELLSKVLERQQKVVNKRVMAAEGVGDPKYKDMDTRLILIMDDCLADANSWKNDENLAWIFYNGRHVDITLIMTMQYQIGIGPKFRGNLDYVFICKETKIVEKEKLWKYYAGMFRNMNSFDQILTHFTKDYGVMVLDNTSQSDKIEEQVYYYKAKLYSEPFRTCCHEFWTDNEVATASSTFVKEEQKKKQIEDDYYKYTGGSRTKPRFNVTIKKPQDPDEEDPEY
jgi:hypothetical protein